MNKELIVTLLQKDIIELAKLTESFEELDFYPNSLLDLAQAKAEKIVENITALRAMSSNAIIDSVQPEIRPNEEPPITQSPEIEEVKIEESISEEPVAEESIDENELMEVEEQEEIIAPLLKEEPAETTKILAETIAAPAITRNDSLQNQKIDDIKHAISLGDRFLFQRELFGGNGELMSKTITALNNCKTLEEAQLLLAKKIDLDMENPATMRFMQIIGRRF